MVIESAALLSQQLKSAKVVRKLLSSTPYVPPATVVVPAASGVTVPTPPVGPSQPTGGS